MLSSSVSAGLLGSAFQRLFTAYTNHMDNRNNLRQHYYYYYHYHYISLALSQLSAARQVECLRVIVYCTIVAQESKIAISK
jgi:hypothetical protein